MDEMIAAGGIGAPSATSKKTTTTLTRALLAAGVVAGPLFYVMVRDYSGGKSPRLF